ncbi:DUF4834 family protein [Hymenobacter guriensis]|uniref:DUF4834 family protein n=1 Tax=Hymenobacter guriensis TaxID=2793065 RepID=A0ABS0KZV5_9BACT|nr:DUF4834 family protein [Hymenobacter guriensis]MBG8553245.1 DUF4834 family protein [Hymenobacter guriensis]
MPKFLLALFIIALLVRFVLPVVLRWALGRVVKKQMKNFGQQFGGAAPFEQPSTPPRPASGNVHVDYVPPKPKRQPRNFKGGEYVEFEELK